MSTEVDPGRDIVSDYYEGYTAVQAEIAAVESRKVRKAIFMIAALLFGGEMIGLLMKGDVTPELVLYSAVIPLIIVGLGFLAIKQPMLAIILATLVFVGLIILSIVVYGSVGIFSGLLVKAVIVYFIIAGFQSSRQAEQAKKDLKT
jgi:hypothetical protein